MTQAGDRAAFRWIVVVLVLAIVLFAACRGSGFDPRLFFDEQAARGTRAFVTGMWPPRTDGVFLGQLADAAVDTLALAALGTAVALTIGFPLGAIGNRAVLYGSSFAREAEPPALPARIVFVAARVVSSLFRSVPEVVWAVLFVRVAGLGPVPAIAGLGVAYGGLIGKVFSEQLEDVPLRPVEALESVGAGRVAAFAWGVLPQAFGSMTSYAAYRFECAIRASTIMGIVGAKGLGMRILISQGDDRYDEIVTEIVVLVAIVVVVEWASDRLRRRTA
jgi:phosphonate transport system permease protein